VVAAPLYDVGARAGQLTADLVDSGHMPPVSEHMSANLLTVSAATPVGEAAKEMDERSVGAVLVLADGRLEGVFTERDVLRAVARGQVEGATVGDFMTPHPETIEPDDTTEHAAVLMIHGGFRHLPVVDGGTVVGILSIRDLMRAVLDDAAPRGV
jgi:CBS domain-containing protein